MKSSGQTLEEQNQAKQRKDEAERQERINKAIIEHRMKNGGAEFPREFIPAGNIDPNEKKELVLKTPVVPGDLKKYPPGKYLSGMEKDGKKPTVFLHLDEDGRISISGAVTREEKLQAYRDAVRLAARNGATSIEIFWKSSEVWDEGVKVMLEEAAKYNISPKFDRHVQNFIDSLPSGLPGQKRKFGEKYTQMDFQALIAAAEAAAAKNPFKDVIKKELEKYDKEQVEKFDTDLKNTKRSSFAAEEDEDAIVPTWLHLDENKPEDQNQIAENRKANIKKDIFADVQLPEEKAKDQRITAEEAEKIRTRISEKMKEVETRVEKLKTAEEKLASIVKELDTTLKNDTAGAQTAELASKMDENKQSYEDFIKTMKLEHNDLAATTQGLKDSVEKFVATAPIGHGIVVHGPGGKPVPNEENQKHLDALNKNAKALNAVDKNLDGLVKNLQELDEGIKEKAGVQNPAPN